MMVVCLGALQSIPSELYEAADVDGASWLSKLQHITLPLLRPALVPAVLLGTVWKRSGAPDKAEQSFTAAHDHGPDDPWPLFQLGLHSSGEVR